MVQINFALKEVNCKVVYYGPGLSGKTTNLEVVHSKAPTTHVGELTSIATEGDRTLFFDFLPLNLGQVAGMNTKFQIYTVPGQVYYNSTRKLVLQGADGIVFVADSRRGKMDENLESLANLEENLREYGMDLRTTPLVLQYNKRDLPDVYSVEEMQQLLNKNNVPYFEAVAVKGDGVFPTLKKLSSMVLESLNRQQSSTAMRRTPKPAPARDAVAVAAGGSRAPAEAAGGTGQGRGAPPRQQPASPPRRSQEPVEERVSDSPGVRPVVRRAGPGAPQGGGSHGHPAPAPAHGLVKKRAPVQIPRAKVAAKGRLAPKLVALVIVLLLGGVAAIYFSGVWRHVAP
jgi:signal recognition particle receptor subunit beta